MEKTESNNEIGGVKLNKGTQKMQEIERKTGDFKKTNERMELMMQ